MKTINQKEKGIKQRMIVTVIIFAVLAVAVGFIMIWKIFVYDVDRASIYLTFLENEELSDQNDWAYAIFDINGDDVEELILYGHDSSESAGIDEYYFYTCSGKEVSYIGNLEHDPFGANGLMYYSADLKAFAVIFRTSSDWYYDFYKVDEDMKADVSAGWTNTYDMDASGNYIYEYTYTEEDGTEQEISEEEYTAIENELEEIIFTSLK